MFCRKCGAECKDGAKFCSKCGAPLQSDSLTNGETVSATDSENNAPSSGGWFQQHKKIALTILIVIVAVVIVIIAVSVARHPSKDADMSPEEHLELGIRYLEDGEYAEAVEELKAVLAVEQNMQAYTYLAEAYLDLSDTEYTGEVQVEFNDEVYEGTVHEVYVDVAGEVYEEAVAYALDTHGQTGDLPDGTVNMYNAATAYEDQYDTVVSQLDNLSPYIPKNEPDGDTNTGDNTQKEDPPSVEEALALLNLFPVIANELMYEWYNGDCEIWDGEITSAEQVYDIAAFATVVTDIYTRTYYTSEDGIGVEGRTYSVLPTDVYEEYLRNMFGEEYSISDFVETKGFVVKDSAGTFYVPVGDFGDVPDMEISIENISDTPNEDGSYDVLAKYNLHYSDDTYGSEYMLYCMKPDTSSDYGYVITDMIAAGYEELDEEYRSMLEEADSDEESYMECQQLYADYLEQVNLEEDTAAEEANADEPEDLLEDYYYYLVCLNDDDVPELLCCSSSDPYRGNTTDHIMYIQDSQVKDQEIANATFAERGGYISGVFATGAYMTYNVWRLNEQNELVTELDAYEDFTEISVNGQAVSEEEYNKKVQEGTAWMTSGEYTVLCVGDGKLVSYDSDKEYASPFATGESDAVAVLRDRYIEPI